MNEEKISIIYLASDYISDLNYITNDERDEQIKKHPNKEVYSLQSFIEAFNDEWISDQGLITIEKE